MVFYAINESGNKPINPDGKIQYNYPDQQISTDFTEITRGNTTKKQIIFTFDWGSGTESIDKILEVLKKHNIKGTFFITGKAIGESTALIKRVLSEGNEVFNHTYSHPHLNTLSNEMISQELQKTDKLLLELTGSSTKPFFRAPFGERNTRVLRVAKEAGFRSVYWTEDAMDWKQTLGETDDTVKKRIISALKPGSIYLMHVGDNITGSILDEVITIIENKGFKIVSLTQGI